MPPDLGRHERARPGMTREAEPHGTACAYRVSDVPIRGVQSESSKDGGTNVTPKTATAKLRNAISGDAVGGCPGPLMGLPAAMQTRQGPRSRTVSTAVRRPEIGGRTRRPADEHLPAGRRLG